MNTSLDHLPEDKKKEISTIINIIRDVANPEMIILFGSYATNSWVEDRYLEDGITYEYISDYDFLVITNDNTEKEYVIIDRIRNRCRQYHTPVNPIVHDIKYVNEGLSLGQYFFTDIVKEGVVLFNTGTVKFSEPKELTPAEIRHLSEVYYAQWFHAGRVYLNGVSFYAKEGELKIAAFTLHQATEAFYSAALLVATGYKPKTHNLDRLRSYAKPLSEDLYFIFLTPATDKNEEYLFDLLQRSYIEARYKKDYTITEEELNALIEKVTRMKAVVELFCQNRINSLG
jgi:HEPN domain-containing protein